MEAKIVTRESLQAMLNNPNKAYVAQVVGRALVAIFNNQTESEKSDNDTEERNGIGFSGADAYSGTLCAKSFLKNKTLADWQIEKWTKLQKNGFSRISKYASPLDAIAKAKKNNC